jgi:hypothetical protein
MVMFSTTLTVIDGFPRALAGLWARARAPELPGDAEPFHRRPYWISLSVLAIVSTMIIAFVGKQGFKSLIDFATSLSFVTAPLLAVLNHRAILGAEVPAAARPGRALIAYSAVGIAFLAAMALGWIWLLMG